MSQTSTDQKSSARLGDNHGYRIDGDTAQLHADVEILHAPIDGDWALQLWACDAPYEGGPLAGLKIAEAALRTVDRSQHLGAEAQARVLGGPRDYAMVLVLASGQDGRYDRVHDFANYPARQRFITPHFDGAVGYRIDGDEVVLEADAVSSPRSGDNLSGSLSLELWALSTSYSGGSFDGHLLGRADLGRLAGQSTRCDIEERVVFSPPPQGHWDVVLMLREWAGPAGYVTRDYARFDLQYTVDADQQSDRPSAIRERDDDESVEPSIPAEAIATEAVESSAQSDAVAVPDDAPTPSRPSINRARVDDLTAVKGIGRTLARQIINGRPYASFEELLDVRGIGPKTLDRLRSLLTL